MDKASMLKIVKQLPFDTKKVVYTDGKTEIYLLRPSKLDPRLKKKGYDRNKNFQIYLRKVGKRHGYKVGHVRVFIDLNLRVRGEHGVSKKLLKQRLLAAFDGIFSGIDPDKMLEGLKEEQSDNFLSPIEVIGHLTQLFVIEQEYSYPSKSNYDPRGLVFQGWLRAFVDEHDDLDKMCMSVIKGRNPPPKKYTCRENRKNTKKYTEKRDPFWYLKQKQ